MSKDIVQHYRKLISGGSLCLVRDGSTHLWRYRSGPNMLRSHNGISKSWPSREFATVEELAKVIGREIDYPDYVDTLPVPRRREAILATRAKTKRTENIVSNE